MLLEIRKKINNLKGKKIRIQVDVGRNKSEEYEGVVLNTYKNIWTLKTNTDIKSFGYYDILIKSVVISSPTWWIFLWKLYFDKKR